MALVQISETKSFKIDCGCATDSITLTWLNNLGGFDYWDFQAKKDNNINIIETGQVKKNILQYWPKSWGAFADTVDKQTYRDSKKSFVVRSQNITESQLLGIAYIRSSVLVQVIVSQTDRRTVIVDEDSFTMFKDGDDIYTISFTINYTDDIPSQT